jgi:hypothetical protein
VMTTIHLRMAIIIYFSCCECVVCRPLPLVRGGVGGVVKQGLSLALLGLFALE